MLVQRKQRSSEAVGRARSTVSRSPSKTWWTRRACAPRQRVVYSRIASPLRMRRLSAASEPLGAVLLGKLNLHEFAYGGSSAISYFGPVRNPWNVAYSPGGSSGGSAAAVAAGLCYGAIGSDTGGSVREPAGYCGIVGLKPTYGRVSTLGAVPLAWSLDHLGPMTRTVKDAAAMLQVIAGYDPEDT